MAYTAVPTKNTGDQAYSADFINTYLRDNLAAMPPDVFTTKGDLFVGTGADTGTRLGRGSDNALLWAENSESLGLKWSLTPNVKAHGNGVVQTDESTSWTTITNVDLEDYDAISSYTDDVFTCPLSGFYFVVGYMLGRVTTASSNQAFYEVGIYKNGSLYSVLGSFYWESDDLTYQHVGGTDIIYCDKGDTLALVKRMNNIWGGLESIGDSILSRFEVSMIPV